MRPPELLCDVLASAPRSPAEREARWAAVVRSLVEIYPELAGAPGEALDDSRMLRVAFDLVDVFVFHASFRALWDTGDRPLWAWRLERREAPCDAWLEEVEVPESRDAGNGWQQAPEVVYEFVLHGPRLAEAFPRRTDGAPTTGRFDDDDAPSVVVAVVRALGRRMLRLAARHGTFSDREADAAERLLVESFGKGPNGDPPGAPSSGATADDVRCSTGRTAPGPGPAARPSAARGVETRGGAPNGPPAAAPLREPPRPSPARPKPLRPKPLRPQRPPRAEPPPSDGTRATDPGRPGADRPPSGSSSGMSSAGEPPTRNRPGDDAAATGVPTRG